MHIKNISLNSRSNACWWMFMALGALRAKLYYLPAFASTPSHRVIGYAMFAYILAIAYVFVGLMRSVVQGKLHTGGLYRYYAHPAYLSYTLIDLSFVLTQAQLSLYNILTSLALNAFLLLTSYYEEQQLLVKFDGAAMSYLSETPSLHRTIAFCKRKMS